MKKIFLATMAIISVCVAFILTSQATSAAPKPMAVKYSCSDTDGGNVITVFGTVSGYYNRVWYSNSDSCVDAGNILEYYCNGVYKTSQQQSCGTDSYGSAYCSANLVYKDFTDYSCSSGACGYSVTPVLQENCDSYDGYVGNNYCWYGNVTRDYRDYYCSSGACSYTTTRITQEVCQWGCNGGVCVFQPWCADTDGGIVPEVQGTVYGYYYFNYSYTDYYNNNASLVEWYCNGAYNTVSNTTCELGCLNGACI